MSGLPPTALISGLSKQDDADTVMRRAAAASQPSNGNVVPFPQQPIAAATAAANPAAGKLPQAPSTSGTTDVAPDTGQDQGLISVTNQIFGLESDFGRNPSTTPSKVGPAVGPMQITPDTWRQYAQPGEDINNRADNKRVGDRVVADLWNKSGGNRTAVLIGYNAGEGAMRRYLQTGQIPPNLETPYRNAIGVDGKTVGPEGLSPGQQELVEIRAQLKTVAEQLSKGGGRSEETWKRLREATDKMNEYQGKLLELAQKPPSPEPRDVFSRLGSLATVVGILGGALTRSPLATSLEAGAAAMDAYNKGDLLTYNYQRENWKTQLGVIEKMATFQNEQVRNLLYDDNMQEGQKMNRLHALLSTLGYREQAAQALLGDARSLRQWETTVSNANRTFSEKIKEDDERERHNRAMEGKPKGSETKFGNIDDLMRRWHEDFVSKNSREPSTDEIAQKRSELQQETKPIGQVGQNVAERIMIGANDVAKTLEALKELPGGTTLGIFGGAQAALGPNMRENVGKALANAATPEASQVLRALSTGVGRALASLVSAGASQGTQMLAEQLKADFPETNDTGLTIASKMADIRQISEAALEVLQNDPRLNPKQQTKVKEVLDKIQTSVPFTTADVARLVNPENRERFTQFAQKLGLGKLPEGIPQGSTLVGTKDGNPVYKDPDGGLHMVH